MCVRFSKRNTFLTQSTVSFHHKRELFLGLERSDPTTSYINTCFDVWTASSPNNNWFSSRTFSHHTKPSKNVQSTFTQVFRELEHVFTLPKNKRVLILIPFWEENLTCPVDAIFLEFVYEVTKMLSYMVWRLRFSPKAEIPFY